MDHKEIVSLAYQINLVMHSMKRVDHPLSINIANFNGPSEVACTRMGIKKWSLITHQEDILEIPAFKGKELI